LRKEKNESCLKRCWTWPDIVHEYLAPSRCCQRSQHHQLCVNGVPLKTLMFRVMSEPVP
jgi:hypothetical protein